MSKEHFKDLLVMYNEKRNEIKELEKELSLIRKRLETIPENDSKDGVLHRVTYSNSVSYAKALPEIKQLIPKTKRHEVDSILDEFTSSYPRHVFTEAK